MNFQKMIVFDVLYVFMCILELMFLFLCSLNTNVHLRNHFFFLTNLYTPLSSSVASSFISDIELRGVDFFLL